MSNFCYNFIDVIIKYIVCILETRSKFIKNDFVSKCKAQTLASFKKYMPPPLPYFKVNIYPFPLPHFASIYFYFFRYFRWPNYIVTLPSYFSFRLPYLNIPTGPPQTNWTRQVSERGLLKISVNETDTATSRLRWIFHMHSEFSRPAMCNNATWTSPPKCKVSL